MASTPVLSVAMSHIRLPNVTWQRSAHILGAAGNLPVPWSVRRKPSYALVTTSMVVTHKIAAIKKNIFTMCYKIFTTKAEHKKMLSWWLSPKVWVCLANCTFPAFPASTGQRSRLLHYQECLINSLTIMQAGLE